MYDKVPFCGKGSHEKFVQERFAEHLFDDAALERLLQEAITRFVDELDRIDEKVFSVIRTEYAFADFPAWETVRDEWSTAALDLSGIVLNDLVQDMKSLVVSEIVTSITVQAARQLGVRLGILGAGAGGSTVSFGTTLVAGLLVDHIVQKLRSLWNDPKETLANEIREWIERLRFQLIEAPDALRETLLDLANKRSILRRQILGGR